jgi:hypothetical protein
MRSPDPQVHEEVTWFRVSPNRASSPGLIWTLYRDLETPKSLQGEQLRQTKQVVLFVFSCVLERRTPFLLSTAFIHSISVAVLMSGNGKNGKKSE